MTQKKTIEQELADFLEVRNFLYNEDAEQAAKAILSSGIIIPVSALDGMVEKVAYGICKATGFICNKICGICKSEAQAAINAIKQEAGKV